MVVACLPPRGGLSTPLTPSLTDYLVDCLPLRDYRAKESYDDG